MPSVSLLSTLTTRSDWKSDIPPRPFCIEEVLLHVLSFLPKRDVLHFALTNRTVLDAALDVLWRHSDSLTPLFELFPPTATTWGGHRHEASQLVCPFPQPLRGENH